MTLQRFALAGIGIIWLVVVRSLGEFFRLQYVQGDALTVAAVTPYVASALFAAAALAVAGTCYLGARYRTSMAVTVMTVLVLLVYKVAIMG
jgi:hypothetical protein